MTTPTPDSTVPDRRVTRMLGPSRRILARRLAVGVLIVGLAYLVVVPLVRLQLVALEDGGRGYVEAFSNPRFPRTLQYTVVLAVGSVVIALILGTVLAVGATRLPHRLRFLAIIPILPIVVPAVAAVVGWAFLLSPYPGYLNALMRKLPWWSGLAEGPVDVYTMPWIVIITGLALTSFVYVFVSSGLNNIGAEYLEAARVSGSNSRVAFFRVTLPLLRPSLLYGGGVALLLGLGQFTAPLLLGRTGGINVITTDIYGQMARVPVEYGIASALASPLLVFGLLVIFAQGVILGDQTRFVTHGGKGFRSERKSSNLAVAGILLYGGIATLLPLMAVAIVALSPFWSARINWQGLTLDNIREVAGNPAIVEAIFNSVTLSLLAVAICLPVGFIVARLLVSRTESRLVRRLLDFIVTAPLGVPAVVFGAAFLMTYINPPFVLYGTRSVMVVVYVTLMLPFSVRMQLAAMISLGETYVEAARVSGSSSLGASVQVLVPMMRSSIAGASALMFVLLTHEFAASLLVRSPRAEVMGTILFNYWGFGSFPLVAVIALVMSLVTAIGVGIALAFGGTTTLKGL